MEAALLQPVAQDEPSIITVRFSNKNYGSWQAARDAFSQLNKMKGGNSVWSKLTLVPDDKSPFQLRCFSCGKSCQLGNPSKWNKEHVCQGPPNSTAGTSAAPSHNNQTRLQEFMMNPDQCHDTCKLFVKGMVQAQASWTGSEAAAAQVVSRQQWGDRMCQHQAHNLNSII
jgi:hypothetical protein